jgi:hypothetical protein
MYSPGPNHQSIRWVLNLLGLTSVGIIRWYYIRWYYIRWYHIRWSYIRWVLSAPGDYQTPFYYYHTNAWNGVTLNHVDMDDFFKVG